MKIVRDEGIQIRVEQCTYINDFHESLVRVRLNKKYGFINKSGKETIECKYDYVSDFHEGVAAVQLNGKWFYIDYIAHIVFEFGLINKISNGILNSSNQKDLKTIADAIRKSDHVSLYYDLIIDDNRVSFSTLEEREQFEKELFIEEDYEKQYTLSKK